MALDGRGDSLDVPGGEQVKQRATQDGEQQRAPGLGLGCLALAGGLMPCQELEPVVHGIPAEPGPRPWIAEQGPGIALDPQGEQCPMGGRGQPGPDLTPVLAPSVAVPHSLAVARFVQVAQLVLACPGEQGADQPFLGAEQE